MANVLERKLEYHLGQLQGPTVSGSLQAYHTRKANNLRDLLKQAAAENSSPIATINHVSNARIKAERGPLHLADNQCTTCRGAGQKLHSTGFSIVICDCVYRRVFRICLNKWREIDTANVGRPVIYMRSKGPSCEYVDQDFRVDFELLALLSLGQYGMDIFYLHFIFHNDWRTCMKIIPQWFYHCQRLGMYAPDTVYPARLDRGTFFHEAYRVQARLGRLYMECKLFPFGEYFGGRRVLIKAFNDQTPGAMKWRDEWLGGGHFRELFDAGLLGPNYYPKERMGWFQRHQERKERQREMIDTSKMSQDDRQAFNDFKKINPSFFPLPERHASKYNEMKG